MYSANDISRLERMDRLCDRNRRLAQFRSHAVSREHCEGLSEHLSCGAHIMRHAGVLAWA